MNGKNKNIKKNVKGRVEPKYVQIGCRAAPKFNLRCSLHAMCFLYLQISMVAKHLTSTAGKFLITTLIGSSTAIALGAVLFKTSLTQASSIAGSKVTRDIVTPI